jgi:hypothetical protein
MQGNKSQWSKNSKAEASKIQYWFGTLKVRLIVLNECIRIIESVHPEKVDIGLLGTALILVIRPWQSHLLKIDLGN